MEEKQERDTQVCQVCMLLNLGIAKICYNCGSNCLVERYKMANDYVAPVASEPTSQRKSVEEAAKEYSLAKTGVFTEHDIRIAFLAGYEQSQQHPPITGKTLQDCKEEVASQTPMKNWSSVPASMKDGLWPKVCELYASQPLNPWVTYEENKHAIECQKNPLLLFDNGEISYYLDKWPDAVVTHFMLNSPSRPAKY